MLEKYRGVQTMYQLQCKNLTQLQKKCINLQKEIEANEKEENSVRQEIEEKKKEIAQLNGLVKAYQKDVMEQEEVFKKESIVILFKDMAKNMYNGKRPTKKEWQKLTNAYKRYMPHIYARTQFAKLTQRELLICILTHLDFSTSEITILIDVAISIISNAKASANTKLFGQTGATTLRKNLKKCAYFQN